jgi:hypothetical protein
MLDNRWDSFIVSCCYKNFVSEAGDSSETQRKKNVGSRYQRTGENKAGRKG